MATRRRAVSRSSTRSSSSKPPKHKSDMNVHQDLPTTAPTQQEASSTITTTTTTTDQRKQPCSPSPTEKVLRNSCNNAEDHEEGHDCNNSWSTPKAKRFRIPEIESCPPAPKKQRASSSGTTKTNGGNTCSNLRRSSISFFTPPELAAEFFFYRVSGVVPNMSTVD